MAVFDLGDLCKMHIPVYFGFLVVLQANTSLRVFSLLSVWTGERKKRTREKQSRGKGRK
jgi:hypothetical protein